ncbi:hypothetical protein MFLAVUS_003283 [Mucor flavus]|uniref:Uncharacterized protein n=1 Tax=Mucor flavus TaxID=439312 RepID=A0ABP9YSN5_9FUNG
MMKTASLVNNYGTVFGSTRNYDEAGSSSAAAASDASSAATVVTETDIPNPDFSSRESTSSKESNDGNKKNYFIHDGESYDYNVPSDSFKWILNGYDVSAAFFGYCDKAVHKAEDLKALNDNDQLSLCGIIIIHNDFNNTDIVDFNHIDDILVDIEKEEFFKSQSIEPNFSFL